MNPLATDRKEVLRIASQTLQHLESGAFQAALPASDAAVAGAGMVTPPIGAVTILLANALEMERLEARLTVRQGGLADAMPDSADVPYIPSNQVLAVLQSAYEEYIAEKGHPPATADAAAVADAVADPFDNADPGWISVAWERLRGLFDRASFRKHGSLTDFRLDLPEDATVALFSDWGTGEDTAARVMQQIRAANPTHAIHLGDVYYSGTKREVENRFLAIIDRHGPSPATCRYFALNANHEMYSGGKGYFETILGRFDHQKASYFNLGNRHWRLIGLDSAYEDHGLKDPQREWLKAQLDGSSAKSILLTHHQLFSPYEGRATDRTLFRKTSDLLPKVFAWFWGHEHKCIIFGDHLGIKARCIGHGAIPVRVPYDAPDGSVPILKVDERLAPDGRAIHGFALLRFSGAGLEVSYIDEFGVEFFKERFAEPATDSMRPRGERVAAARAGAPAAVRRAPRR